MELATRSGEGRRARIAALALAWSLGVYAVACRGPHGRDDALVSARETAALAWVNALAGGDAATLGRLTADPFILRTASADRRCDGPVAGKPAFDEWWRCARALRQMQQMSAWWKVFRDERPRSPESAALERYLPRVVDRDEAWSRFIGAEERGHAQAAFDAVMNEAGRDGDWIVVAGRWLHTSAVFRLQVVGPAASPRVHAILVDVTPTAE